MAKNFNIKTASLKATVGDIRKLDARVIDSQEIKLGGINIEELWGFQDPEDFKKLIKRYTLTENDDYILWTDMGAPVYMSFADKLVNGTELFKGKTGIYTFNIDMPKLENATSMFSGCVNLASFDSDLSKLTNGTSMFGSSTTNCTRLDLISVQNIANNINDLTVAGTTGSISIGIQTAIYGTTELATALNAIEAKGWTVRAYYKD